MKIKQLHMFRYGMFVDTIFPLPSDGFQVVYGVNEAGKSTMMRFIREILFGFSSQSPGISIAGGEGFGGCLTLEVPVRGDVTVERTGNRGRGSVKVYFDDGRIGGEEALAELFPGLDESMFRAIFSFGLDGLQGLERVKSDEVNNYLFHAGMTGDFSIRKLEKKLVKKQEELFKPQGRKPLLNRELAELETLEKEVASWRRKNEGYRELGRESDEVERRIAEIAKTKSTLRNEIRALEKQKALAPFVKDKRELELRLERLPVCEPFPEDGLARFEEWRTQAVALEAELAELEAERKAVEKKRAGVEVREDWLGLKEEVRYEREQERFMQNKESERAACEQAARTEGEELAVLMERLGSLWTREMVEAADTGFGAREGMKELVQARESLQQRRKVMDDERERLERLLEKSRAEREAVSAKRLADDERRRLEEALSYRDEWERKRKEKRGLEEQLARSGSLSKQLPFYGGTALGAMVVIWLISNGQWVVGAVVATLTAGFAFSVLRFGRGAELDRVRTSLATLAEELRKATDAGIEDTEKAKLSLKEDDQVRESEAIVNDRLAQGERAFDEAVEQTEAVRQQLKRLDRQMSA
ncbi:MAG TPA: AAA family ATPase, partial [Bacillales bacterium]|nr:AAA family ATPase [Bacillales bacterium]